MNTLDNLRMRILLTILSLCLLFGISSSCMATGIALTSLNFSDYTTIIVVFGLIGLIGLLGSFNRFNTLLALIELYGQNYKHGEKNETP